MSTTKFRFVDLPKTVAASVGGLAVLFFFSAHAHGSGVLTLRAVGDTMLGNFSNNQIPQTNYLQNVRHETHRADINFVNYEGTLCDLEEAKSRCEAGRPGCYTFRGPTRLARDLREAGFQVANVANNHIFDYGSACADQTVKALEDEGLAVVGLKSSANAANSEVVRTVQARGKRVAFLGFNFSGTAGRIVSIADFKTIVPLIKKAKANHDVVVVSAHAGAEGAAAARVPHEMEFFMGRPRGDMRVFTKTVIDAGADLVIVHGPHVLRGLEIYKDKLIIHSLGNFANYTMFSLAPPANLGAIVEVSFDENGDFFEGMIVPTHQFYHRTVSGQRGQIHLEVDPRKRAISEIRRLSELDFDSRPDISDDGRISRPTP